MQRNQADVWPDYAPIGTFDVIDGAVEGQPGATAHIQFVCPNGKRCAVLLGPSFVPKATEDALNVWGWNGDHERPTLTPSVNCLSEKNGKPTGGCGWHGFIIDGEFR